MKIIQHYTTEFDKVITDMMLSIQALHLHNAISQLPYNSEPEDSQQECHQLIEQDKEIVEDTAKGFI